MLRCPPALCLLWALVACESAAPADGAVLVEDRDGDGSPADLDCDDLRRDVGPGAEEACDGLDNDCDGEVDEAGAVGATVWVIDWDADGRGDAARRITRSACVAPAGFVSSADDCDDTNPAARPGAAELCDGVDNDCDALVDEGVTLDYFLDVDGDGAGDPAAAIASCAAPDGAVRVAGDCDDRDPTVGPGAAERCNGQDDDCDGEVDEDDAEDAATWYPDEDGDAWGLDALPLRACDRPPGAVAVGGDCDDADSTRHPGAWEVCNGEDDDCDGTVDGAGALDAEDFFTDADRDGAADPSRSTRACADPRTGAPPSGMLRVRPGDPVDCVDTDAAVSPFATEACNGQDDDCDGIVDEAGATGESLFYVDADGDGYGSADARLERRACTAPTGTVTNRLDCDDADAAVSPGGVESCDGEDNDCDGFTDEAGASGGSAFYLDRDGDRFGDPARPTVACAAPLLHVADDTDCDDLRADRFPGATELCNGGDDDCDGTVDEASAADALVWYADLDADGFGNPLRTAVACAAPVRHVANAADCNDREPLVRPGALDACDSVDNDCDGVVDDPETSIGAGESCPAASCLEIRDTRSAAVPSGTYLLAGATSDDVYTAWCDMEHDGGGWTLVAANLWGGLWTSSAVIAEGESGPINITSGGVVLADHRSAAWSRVPATDIWVISGQDPSAPGAVWAQYDGVGDGARTLLDIILRVPENCGSRTGVIDVRFPLSDGTLRVPPSLTGPALCSTDLFINVHDHATPIGCDINGGDPADDWAFGLAWSVRDGGDCPLENPGSSSFINQSATAAPFGQAATLRLFVR